MGSGYAAFPSAGGGAGIADLVLWKWNGEDLTQFGAEIGTHTGTMTVSVVADGEMPSRNRIRHAGSGGFSGQAFRPILGLFLPRRYIARVRMHVHGAGTGSDNLALLLISNIAAGLPVASLFGMQIAIDGNGTNYVIEAGARDTVGTVSMTASGVLSTAGLQALGLVQEYYVDRAPDPNPVAEPRFSIHRPPVMGPGVISLPAADGISSGQFTTVFDAGWAGLTLDRAGIGVSQTNVIDTTYEISELEFLRHPMEYDVT